MQRVGYDADTGKYYFRDQASTLWEGPQGAQYGELRRGVSANLPRWTAKGHETHNLLSFPAVPTVSGAPPVVAQLEEAGDEHDDLEAAPGRADGYQPLAVDPVRTGTSADPRCSYDLLLTFMQDQTPHRNSFGSQVSAYRMIFPFFLLIAVALLFVIRLVHSPSTVDPPLAKLCPNATEVYRVQQGDTCWGLSQTRGCSVDRVREVNPGLECDKLTLGQVICLPESAPSR